MLFYGNLSEFIAKQSEKLQPLERDNVPEVGVILDVLGPSDNQDREANPGWSRRLFSNEVKKLGTETLGNTSDRKTCYAGRTQ